MFKNLITDRLLLRNIETEDRDFIFHQFSNDTVNRYLFDAEPLTKLEQADEIIDFYIYPESRLQHRWVIIRKKDNAKMGTCGFHCWNKNAGIIDIGYDLREEFWGKGYMQEALKEIIVYADEVMRVKEIRAMISVDNVKSIRLAESLNFKVKGSEYVLFRNKKYLHNIYRLYLKENNEKSLLKASQ
ncbi:GNAT family N-acetyltransferase [Anaerocolumna sp. AGMB13020]|uniref:GNAT family N-acetyltransferase n=1 Tax=Anaerocolumna sp. AGMB13020 TaxID=3081750 RepID=UPI0029548BDD|nr:GNAT family N-acetyltransferase [Anaerocolumna sp. AGMB13020]WOO37343.1 GNAT family N-acetyltransferase [Anaerocolumna sp. AGMB13020]